MNPPDPESKSNNFLFAALVGSIAVLFGIFGCYAFIGYSAGGIERGYPGPDIDDEASKYADRTPQWSAGGDQIVVNVEHWVLAVNVSGGEPFDIRGKRGWRQYSPSLSLDGRVAYETRPSGSRERRIALTDLLGSDLEVFPQEKEHYAIHPVWSKDGEHLAYVTYASRSSDSPKDRWLTIVDAAGSGETHSILLDHEFALYKPVWSNDGKDIAFLESFANRYRIRTVSRDGTDVRVFNEMLIDSKTVGISRPAWSLGDDRLYFVKRAELPSGSWNSSLYSIGSNGANEAMIADLGDITVDEIKLSPDGSMLLLDGSHVVNVDGTGLRGFQRDYGASPGYGSWSPDGSRIAVFTGRDYPQYRHVTSGGRLYTMSPDGSDVRTLINWPSAEE